MAVFKAINPNVEVNGRTVLSLVNGLGAFQDNGIRYLEMYGIKDVKSDGWYPQQSWLDAFKYISERIGTGTVFMIGKSIPESSRFPPEINNIFKALGALDVAYHINHRLHGRVMFDPSTGKMEEGIGHYRYKRVDEKRIELTCDNPYPCDFDKGIITQMANKFKPGGSFIIMEHDKAHGCRNHGAETCTYTITW
ncbi:conserved hypothetical protein [Chloroherpeton thalassium ATCC 35110]|uniref:4-vinyl reductase 4VR domain-containing protein n=1 Tax=Chloroherpeton thalassium (strain ATCC 35110 / GB-78) TaxID=517418 RepID=B3QST1_CHLT3|nr:hypothetical protein [Chloroherpeton thalassium]ACF14128.1 conserved hypothetical protein [Chloroherpeton thalassium ATCC 35110]